MQRILHLLIALDQMTYVILTLGAGSPDETLSAAAWRTEQDGKFWGVVMRPVIDLLFLAFERNHCKTAFESELNRKHLPAEYKQNTSK